MSIWIDRTLIRGPNVGLCTSEAMFHRELRRLELPRAEWPSFVSSAVADATVHIIEFRDKPCMLVCIKGFEARTGMEIAGLLVHEAVHVWQWFRRFIGEDQPSDEFEAYSIQTISQRLMEVFLEQTTKGRHVKAK